ncbi:MAG: lysophospholipase and related esterase [Ferruginibacter sp.]|nr:lysophospholipase and related esterase [Ferruginibacter sp.]
MMRILLIPFIILQLASSCKKEAEPHYVSNPVTPPVAADTTTLKTYLALGDSYTIGQSVAIADRFPVQTVEYLGIGGIKFSDPEIIAQTGWTTGDLLSRLSSAAPIKPSYDIVTLLIGVNNQYQHRSPQEYTDQFSTLLIKSIQYAGNKKTRVFVLSIPDYSVTPYASGSDKASIAREIDSFNVINKTISTQMAVNYVDITPASRLAANDRTLIATDGLHPSGLQYKLWAEVFVPVIKKALQ